MPISLELFIINYRTKKYVKENTLLNLLVFFTSERPLFQSLQVPEMKQNIIIKHTIFTFFEMGFFPHCDGNLIQKFTFVL
jgi:hypothetical protein